MRLFEGLLAGASLILLCCLVLNRRSISRGIATFILGLIQASLLLIQLYVEGYRWQMAAIYIASVILFIRLIFAAKLKRGLQSVGKSKRYQRYSLYAFLFVCVSVSVILSVALPVTNLPAPDGKYKVGIQSFHFIDQNREEIFTNTFGDHRELMVRVWYPADNDMVGKKVRLFPENKEIFREYLQAFSKEMGLPAWMLDYWKYFGSHAYAGAKVQSQGSPFPLIILSHGMGTSSMFHVSQAENLASHGYIVAAIDHTYSTLVTAFPDGRIMDFKTTLDESNFYQEGTRIGQVWEEDVEFVLNKLEDVNSAIIPGNLAGTMDFQHVGLMGHSFGGAIAYQASSQNSRIKAGVNMDGTLLKVQDNLTMNKPFLFMRAEDYVLSVEKLKQETDIEELLVRNLLAEFGMIERALEQRGYLLLIDGASHFNFTDLQIYSPLIRWIGMTGKMNGQRGVEIVNRYVLDFFNEHLKGSSQDLLDKPSGEYPEVKFYSKNNLKEESD